MTKNEYSRQSLEYIRKYYGVDARKGVEITYTGDPKPRHATIVGADGAHIRARFHDTGKIAILHPTWEVEYRG